MHSKRYSLKGAARAQNSRIVVTAGIAVVVRRVQYMKTNRARAEPATTALQEARQGIRITQDYQEVWSKEVVALVIMLQRCPIHARATPDTFCGVVQELCECLAPVVKKANFFTWR